MLPSFTSATSPAPDALIAGEFPRVTEDVIISSGQNLAAGSVLGRVTASGEYILSLSAAADGSQTPVAILAEAIDATAADTQGVAYFSGEFAESSLVLGAAHTIASIRAGLRTLGIYLKTIVPA